VNEIISIQIDQAQTKQIQIDSNFKDFDDNTTLINTDMRRLQQVLLNLLSNAIKFTGRNGQISINCQLIKSKGNGPKTHVQIEVTDNGVGMTQ